MTTPIVPSITDEQLAELESSYEHAYCTIPGSLIAALVLRLRAAETDAARYRFLRSDVSRGKVDFCVVRKHWGEDSHSAILELDEADNEIDTAMEQSK
jgi:hypothetical protein